MVLPAYLPSQSPKSTVLPADLRYYIVRKSDNGSSYVPLVPADQLPFRLHGVPTELDKEQAKEEEWHLVTRTSESKFTLAVQAPAQQLLSPPPSPNTGYRAPDHDVKTESRNRTPAPETDLARIPYNLVNGMSTSASAALGIGLDLRKAAAQVSRTLSGDCTY